MVAEGILTEYARKSFLTLKKRFPRIKNTLVLSYIPAKDFSLPSVFDDSVYLLEKAVLPRFAITETNRLLVQKADFVVLGVQHKWGGAHQAIEYAKRQKKRILSVASRACTR